MSNKIQLPAREINFRPYPIQKKFMDSKAIVKGIVGPMGSGKSTVCLMSLFDIIIKENVNNRGIRESRIAVVRNTAPALEASVVKQFEATFGDDGVFGHMRRSYPMTYEFDFIGADGIRVMSEICFLALDTSEDEKKVRSVEFTAAWFNECKYIQLSLVSEMAGRLGRFPNMTQSGTLPRLQNGQLLLDTNACDTDHWYYQWSHHNTWALNADGSMKDVANLPDYERFDFFQQPSGLIDTSHLSFEEKVKIAINLPQGKERYFELRSQMSKEQAMHELVLEHSSGAYMTNPEAENLAYMGNRYYLKTLASSVSNDWTKANLMCEFLFTTDGKPVYSGYSNTLHVVDNLPINPTALTYVGIDYGNNGAAVFGQKDNFGRWNIVAECVVFDLSLIDFANILTNFVNQYFANNEMIYYGDPSGEYDLNGQKASILFNKQSKGTIKIREAPTNKLQPRLIAVSNVLSRLIAGKPALSISKNKCPMLYKGFEGGYCIKKLKISGDVRYSEIPDKNKFSHVHDALQYMFCGAGEYIKAEKKQNTGQLKKNTNGFKWGTYSYA